MSSERGGLLKTRAEDFARRLHTRLKSLSDAEDWSGEVSSSSDNEVYYDIDSSLASPQEELHEPIFIASQNRDSLPLERSDSGSQYFDAEEIIQNSSSPVSSCKRIPILHLKTESPSKITNGHTHLLDADVGCSRVLEMPSVEIDLDVREKINDTCHCEFVDNNNSWTEFEEPVDKGLDEESCVMHDGDVTVEVDTQQKEDGIAQDIDEDEEATNNSFCVFCDIEQMKCNYTTNTSDLDPSKSEETKNDQSNGSVVEKEVEITESKPSLNDQNVNDPLSEVEENLSLTDLLQVLKNEISNDTEENKCKLELKEIESNSSLQVCPAIEIIEPSPTEESTGAKDKNKENEVFDIEIKRKNFRRCSSLKSGKTPPGTPGRKKIVRFADVFGLDLADVKTFLDEVPTIPKSAYEDLHLSSSPVMESPLGGMTVIMPVPNKILVPKFQQPCMLPFFLDRVRANNVCLENAVVSDMSLFAITGLVRVRNIDFHKSVYIRYSINGWRSYSDLQARYVPNSCDGFSDKFGFTLYAHTLVPGQKLEFAVRFHAGGGQYWDSNGGSNYVFECTSNGPLRTFVEPGVPPSPVETWASFL